MEFVEFGKIGRFSRDIIITEKIDGTNAQIAIGDDGSFQVGSRTRWITPDDDNFGFARWATEHKDELLKLGPGRHFGEWWGSGIQRGSGLTKGDKRFSLFNVQRWALPGTEPQRIHQNDPRIEKYQDVLPDGCGLVPILYRGEFETDAIKNNLDVLRHRGSLAAPGFMQPEGVVIFHTQSGVAFKKTLDKDDQPKSLVR